MAFVSHIVHVYGSRECDVPLRVFLIGCLVFDFLTVLLSLFLLRRDRVESTIWLPVAIVECIWSIIGQVWFYKSQTCSDTNPTVYWSSLVLFFVRNVFLCPQLIVLFVACAFVMLKVCCPRSISVSQREINSLPRRTVDESSPQEECAICLVEYHSGDEIRRLPCSHEYHVQCIDRWLSGAANCPTCRTRVFPTRAASQV